MKKVREQSITGKGTHSGPLKPPETAPKGPVTPRKTDGIARGHTEEEKVTSPAREPSMV